MSGGVGKESQQCVKGIGLMGVWIMYGDCLQGVWGGCLDGMWTVCEEYLEGERLKGLGQSPQICTVRQCGTSTFDFFFRNVL